MLLVITVFSVPPFFTHLPKYLTDNLVRFSLLAKSTLQGKGERLAFYFPIRRNT